MVSQRKAWRISQPQKSAFHLFFLLWLLYGAQLLTIKAMKICALFDNCIFILGENKYILEASENWEKRKKNQDDLLLNCQK